MERFMYQDDSFEQILKQKADVYRMYPSDNSWESIRKRLDQKNRFSWKRATFFTLTFVSLSLWISVRQHQVDSIAINNTSSAPDTGSYSDIAVSSKNNPASTIQFKKPVARKMAVVSSPEQNTVIHFSETSTPVVINEQEKNNAAVSLVGEEGKTTADHTAKQLLTKATVDYRLSSIEPTSNFASTAGEINNLSTTAVSLPDAKTTEFVPVPDVFKTDGELNYEVSVPVLVNSLQKPPSKLQLFITPSASYRVLISDNRFTFGNFRDPDAAVTHRSSMGMEAGAALLLPVSKRLSFRTGFQMNYTKYIVTASRYQQELTTINFTTSGSTQRTTNLRTNNGYFPEDVANTTLQLSIPLGLEYRLAGDKRFSFNVGAGLQPSYQLQATGILVTNDLKNYIKAPDLLSKLNLNSNLETFFRWSGRTLEFQAGPQLRYQLFSNSKGKYPVQEHLVDYGFKFGIIKTLK
jgi:hypothetical protein